MSLPLAAALATWLALAVPSGALPRIVLGLPATAAHELAHWVVALLTGGRPGLPSIWPRREGDKWLLGHVEFRPHWLFAGAVALAPLWVLGPCGWWLVRAQAETGVTDAVLKGVAAGYLFRGALPSTQDWYIAAKYPVGSVAVIATLAFSVSHLFGIDTSIIQHILQVFA